MLKNQKKAIAKFEIRKSLMIIQKIAHKVTLPNTRYKQFGYLA